MDLGKLIGKGVVRLVPTSVKEGLIAGQAEAIGARIAAVDPAQRTITGRLLDLLKRNKGRSSIAYLAVVSWAFSDGCVAPAMLDWIVLPEWLTCARIQIGLLGFGFMGLGAGWFDSDIMARFKQIRQRKLPDPRKEQAEADLEDKKR